jgi:hypothetical protein
MKFITALYMALFLMVVACGPHFIGKPDFYVEPVPVAQAPQNIQLTVPNWPVFAYNTHGAIMILLVEDPKTFPVPGSVRLSRADGSVVEMQILNKPADGNK